MAPPPPTAETLADSLAKAARNELLELSKTQTVQEQTAQ